MDSGHLTFKSDYLSKTYYVLGDYCFLKSGLFKGILPRVFFTKDMRKNVDCDILVVNLGGRGSFRMPPPNLKYRCTIYTIRPFESIIRYFDNDIKYRCVVVDLLDFFLVINLERGAGSGSLLKADSSSSQLLRDGKACSCKEEFLLESFVSIEGGNSTLAGAKIYVMLRKLGYVEMFEQLVNNLLRSFISLPVPFTDEEETRLAEEDGSKNGYSRICVGMCGIIVAYIPVNGIDRFNRLKDVRKGARKSTTDRGRKARMISLSATPGPGYLRNTTDESNSIYHPGTGLVSRGVSSQPPEDSIYDKNSSEGSFTSNDRDDCNQPVLLKRRIDRFAPETQEESRKRKLLDERSSRTTDAVCLSNVFSTFWSFSSQGNSQEFHSRDYRDHRRSSSQA